MIASYISVTQRGSRFIRHILAGGLVALIVLAASGCNKADNTSVAEQPPSPPVEGSSPPPEKLPKTKVGRSSTGGSPAPSSSPGR
jgi:hypothetical protein